MANQACPNYSDPKFKELVNVFKEVRARFIYHKMGKEEFPTVEEAKEFLENLYTKEKDEVFTMSSDELKYTRMVQQMELLNSVKTFENKSLKEIIDKLKDMTQALMKIYANNIDANIGIEGVKPIKTYSNTAYIGSSEFKGDPIIYEDFRRYGIFMHEIFEKVQEEALCSDAAASCLV